MQKVDLMHYVIEILGLSWLNWGSTGYDGYNKVDGSKLSVQVDQNGLQFAWILSLEKYSGFPDLRANHRIISVPRDSETTGNHLSRCGLMMPGGSVSTNQNRGI